MATQSNQQQQQQIMSTFKNERKNALKELLSVAKCVRPLMTRIDWFSLFSYGKTSKEHLLLQVLVIRSNSGNSIEILSFMLEWRGDYPHF